MTAVWITRTEPSASAMARYFRRVSIRSCIAPLLAIEGVSASPPKECFDLAVYLSQHAVRYAGIDVVKAQRHMAIGATTARAVSRLGFTCELPERPSSEGILETVSTTLRTGSSILIVCGEDGRNLLRTRLAELGYKVRVWSVYRRVCSSRKPRLDDEIDVVELSSVTSLQTYWKTVRQRALTSTEDPTLIVPSARIGKLAKLRGFERIHVARNASPSSYSRVIRKLNEHG